MSYTTKDKTLAERAPIDDMTEQGLARVIADALHAHYGPFKASAKCIANDCGASVQSAKNWLAGIVAPSAVYLKRLERKVPGLAAEMRRLQAMETDIDPLFQRQLVELLQRLRAAEGV